MNSTMHHDSLAHAIGGSPAGLFKIISLAVVVPHDGLLGMRGPTISNNPSSGYRGPALDPQRLPWSIAPRYDARIVAVTAVEAYRVSSMDIRLASTSAALLQWETVDLKHACHLKTAGLATTLKAA